MTCALIVTRHYPLDTVCLGMEDGGVKWSGPVALYKLEVMFQLNDSPPKDWLAVVQRARFGNATGALPPPSELFVFRRDGHGRISMMRQRNLIFQKSPCLPIHYPTNDSVNNSLHIKTHRRDKFKGMTTVAKKNLNGLSLKEMQKDFPCAIMKNRPSRHDKRKQE